MYTEPQKKKQPDFGEAITNAGVRIYNEEQLYKNSPEESEGAIFRRGLERAREILREEYEKQA